MNNAQQELQAISAEMRRVNVARSLDATRQIALEIGRERQFRARIGKIRRSPDWSDIGALKRELIDLWLVESNTLKREAVKDVKLQRAEGGQ